MYIMIFNFFLNKFDMKEYCIPYCIVEHEHTSDITRWVVAHADLGADIIIDGPNFRVLVLIPASLLMQFLAQYGNYISAVDLQQRGL